MMEEQLKWDIPMLIGSLCIAVFYMVLVKSSFSIKISLKQPLLFFLGLIVLYITLGSPLAMLSHLSFSTHMIQMSILYFIVPPILIFGFPLELFQRNGQNRKPFLIVPMISLFIFGFLFFMYHMPILLNSLSQSHILHSGFLLFLFILSFSMWWPIATPSFQPSIYSNNPRKKRFAHLSGIVIMPACLFLIVSALFGGLAAPFNSHANHDLFIFSQSSSLAFLSTIFQSKFDQFFAGIVMLGLHKLGIFMTLKIGNS